MTLSKDKKYPKPAIIKYLLLQIPALILLICIVLWFYLSGVLSLIWFMLIVLIWVMKDVLLFFVVWKAYDTSKKIPVSERGMTIENLDPDGYIEVGSELWRATCTQKNQTIKKGREVKIIAIKGLTLEVAELE